MQKDAQQRAERYRLRAEELLQLGDLTCNAMLKEHYKRIADGFLTLAENEEFFADQVREFCAISARRRIAAR